ncbi:hypothetical protein JCM33374_g3572 [Metschnikowia sp. JCM 33374]|nr:hypothetical protein JCM33374_g3572 [Metschnikowia sp. JCM 33374]
MWPQKKRNWLIPSTLKWRFSCLKAYIQSRGIDTDEPETFGVVEKGFDNENETENTYEDQMENMIIHTDEPFSDCVPPAAVEAAWQHYLSPSERAIHVGSATFPRLATEVFEKKNKGYIHDTPLGFNSRLQPIGSRSTSHSVLSHVVQGNRMRDANEFSARVNLTTRTIPLNITLANSPTNPKVQ